MKITLDLDSLAINDQQAIYFKLKAKFDHPGMEKQLQNNLDLKIWDQFEPKSDGVAGELVNALIFTIRDLCLCTRSDLKMKGFDKGSVECIEDFLKGYGLTLKSG
jgi:hypothetical protein